ncbi:DUF2163 domain-containing protein [Vibrio furnissii]|uniref:baseplate hub domain-containing protein n=1 Tax=Vibrio furnissii TaxID=29494 RepID=UPI001EE9D568|nr:DUF2163 domain-containing protein [Vibrio furnissii]MCG6268315.1 DUF2163 domain-containing protein [Vibrio furnissii]
MKAYPPKVLAMLQSGLIRQAHLLRLDLDTPLAFTDAGFDIEYGGILYRVSSSFQGLDNIKRSAEIKVSEVKLGFSMASDSMVALLLGGNIYQRKVTMLRAFLDDDNTVMHAEPLWSGTISGRSDDDSKAQVQLTVSSRWAKFESVNAWRTTPSSHQRRRPGDECFKYAAKASETTYWGGKAGAN